MHAGCLGFSLPLQPPLHHVCVLSLKNKQTFIIKPVYKQAALVCAPGLPIHEIRKKEMESSPMTGLVIRWSGT